MFCKNNGCRILPSLDNNIKNGNSLVDEKYMQYNQDLLEDPNWLKIKIFNWETEFAGKNLMQLLEIRHIFEYRIWCTFLKTSMSIINLNFQSMKQQEQIYWTSIFIP